MKLNFFRLEPLNSAMEQPMEQLGTLWRVVCKITTTFGTELWKSLWNCPVASFHPALNCHNFGTTIETHFCNLWAKLIVEWKDLLRMKLWSQLKAHQWRYEVTYVVYKRDFHWTSCCDCESIATCCATHTAAKSNFLFKNQSLNNFNFSAKIQIHCWNRFHQNWIFGEKFAILSQCVTYFCVNTALEDYEKTFSYLTPCFLALHTCLSTY